MNPFCEPPGRIRRQAHRSTKYPEGSAVNPDGAPGTAIDR